MCAGRVANDAGLRTLQGRERCWRHAARRVGAGRGLTRGAAAGPGAERVGGGGGGGAGAARAPPGAADARAGDVRGGAGARPGQLRAPGAARALSAKAETFPLPSSRSLFVSFPSLASLSLSRSVSLSPPQRASRPAPSRRRSGSSTQFCPSPRRSRRSPPRASMPPPQGSSPPTRARARTRPSASARSARARRHPSAAARWRRRCGNSRGSAAAQAPRAPRCCAYAPRRSRASPRRSPSSPPPRRAARCPRRAARSRPSPRGCGWRCSGTRGSS
jgi:hypothetical protein